jgi:hypothetical protein
VPIAISPEQRALQASIREWANQAGTIALVRRLEPGAKPGTTPPALTLCGPDGAASDGPAADAVHGFLLSRCLSIAGGTSQILLNVVAERALGLPREETR